MKDKIVIVGLVVALALAGFATFQPAKQVVERVIGASSPDVYTHLNVHGVLTMGGGKTATSSTASSYTLTRAEMVNVGVIEWTPNVNTTVTLPATSTLTDIIPFAGDRMDIWLYNASTTAGATITLAAGTGIDLQKNEDTADLAVNGLDWSKLTFIRQSDTDITVIMSEFIEAD